MYIRRVYAPAVVVLLMLGSLVTAPAASAHGNCFAGNVAGWGASGSGTNIVGTGYGLCESSHADTYVTTVFRLAGSVWRGDGSTHCTSTDYCEDHTNINCDEGAGDYEMKVHIDVYNASGALAHSDTLIRGPKFISCHQ